MSKEKEDLFIKYSSEIGKTILEEAESEGVIRCISHLDTDGLCSAGLASMFLLENEVKFHLTIIKQLTPGALKEILREKYRALLLLDLGSGQLDLLEKKLPVDRKVFIVDHHPPEKERVNVNIHQVNPYMFGLDGSIHLSGSGTAYFTFKDQLRRGEGAEWLGIVGAIGDQQDKSEYSSLSGLNSEIVKIGIEKGIIKEEIDLNIFGRFSRPLHKALEYTFQPYIPGISGDEVGAVTLLRNIGVELKGVNGDWRKLSDLTDEEKKKLTEKIIERIMHGETFSRPSEILAMHYVNLKEELNTLRDAREFSTILNACGKLGRPDVGVLLCLGVRGEIVGEAEELLIEYRKTLADYLNKILSFPNKYLVKKEEFIVISPKAEIRDTLIGPVSSILLSQLAEKRVVIGVSRVDEGKLKISGRARGDFKGKSIDLGLALREGAKAAKGIGGGHRMAAGAEIKQNKLGEFIKALEENIKKQLAEGDNGEEP